MFGEYYYNGITKKALIIFARLFNDVSIIVFDDIENNKKTKRVKVPISFGSKQRALSFLDNKTGKDAVIATTKPLMSCDITSISLNPSRNFATNSAIVADNTDNNNQKTINTSCPCVIDFQLNITAKEMHEALQIFEQIIPYFSTPYTVSAKLLKDFPDVLTDVPVALTGISYENEYEGDFAERRYVNISLDFTMMITYYGKTTVNPVVTTVVTDVKDTPAQENSFFTSTTQVNPSTAKQTDPHTIETIIDNNVFGRDPTDEG